MRGGEPIQEVELKARLNTEIEVDGIPGLVPRFYEMTACIQANYCFYGNWKELAPEDREELVAHFILDNLIEGHKNEVVNQKIKKDQAKKQPKSRG